MNKRETPPGANPAARKGRNCGGSAFDGVAALAVLALGGRDRQPHLLPNGPGQEAAHGMRLPASGLLQFLGCDPARPLQQVQDRGRLAAIGAPAGLAAAAGFFAPLAFGAPLGAFFAGLAFFPAFPLAGATGARRGARLAFLVALGGSPAAVAGEVAVPSSITEFMFSPCAVNPR